MKKIFSLLVLAFSVTLLHAQSSGLGKNDPEAKKVLDAVSSKFKSYKVVTAKFTLKMENNSGKAMSNKSGTVYMKGKKYRVSVAGQEIFSDGSTIWTYDKGANEVKIDKIDPSASTLTPQKLFTNFYDKDFLYRLNGMVANGGKKMQEIELTPTDKSKPFHKVLLYVDQSTIKTTKIFEKSGNRYIYSVSSMNTTAPIDDKMFIFDASKYPGVEVVDLR